ncbi:uncharacterized protein Triagg1_592 [Trichoderma aggressivum f. europaeum]|uniref:Uncharacterized protein n=1 Tax=Trichoderma aggressivum f. europaeum TaxID=173218 RepID=A0AAE1IKI7_9HYPO|nr:hypothetical protein Triagg1_592 [Trichoderma aggressivum f. europaeum]
MTYVRGVYSQQNWSPTDYPLLTSNYDYKVRDVFVEATLTETYQARARGPQEVSYMFEIPPEASVIKFSAQVGDIIVQAIVDEKEEAQRKYQEAKKANDKAWLLDKINDEVLQITLGNVSPDSLIITRVTYVHVISTNNLEDSVRLTIPAGFAARPGSNPNPISIQPAAPAGTDPVITITVGIEVQQTSEVQSLDCISHKVTIVPGFSDNSFSTMNPVQKQQNRRYWKSYVAFSSSRRLNNHFVLVWTVPLIDQPRCNVERLDNPVKDTPETLAFALTMVSNVKLPLEEHEYIFLIDTSGSMAGSRIETANRVVKTMLTQLPRQKKSTFNIYTFSTTAQSIVSGQRSLHYDTSEVANATSKLSVNVSGGTDIKAALDTVFKQRDVSKPRCSVIVITDGLDWGVAAALQTVQANVEAAEAQSKLLRVFVMGLGDQVSRGMCEALARAGAGATAYISEGQLDNQYDNQDLKAETLINAINYAPIRVISVDWGVKPNKPAVVRADDGNNLQVLSSRPQPNREQLGAADKGDNLPPPLAIQQAPLPGTMFWAFRSSWYAIINGTIRDRKVKISYQIRGSESSTEVFQMSYENEISGHLIHSLAAKALIQTLEDKAHSIKDAKSDESYYNKCEIVRLGKMYSLSSTQTSFIATSNGIGIRTNVVSNAPPGARSLLSSLPVNNTSGVSEQNVELLHTSPPQSVSATGRSIVASTPTSKGSVDTVTTLAPTAGSTSTLTTNTATPEILQGPFRALALSLTAGLSNSTSTPSAEQEADSVLEMIALQDSNGAFNPNRVEDLVFASTAIPAIPAFLSILNGSGNVKEQVWVTICVIAFLQKKHAQRSSDWSAAISKAEEFVKTTLCNVFSLDSHQAEGIFIKSLRNAEAHFY